MKKSSITIVVMILVPAIFSIGGCSTDNIKKDYSLSSNPDKGIILASVTKDYISGTKGYTDNIYISDSNEEPFAHLIAWGGFYPWSSAGNKDVIGNLAVISAPQGNYSLSGWQISGNSVTIYPKINPDKVSFTVKKGKITYIGNIHMRHLVGKNVFGIDITGGAVPLISDKSERDYKLLFERYPQLRNTHIEKQLPLIGYWAKGIEPLINVVPISPTTFGK